MNPRLWLEALCAALMAMAVSAFVMDNVDAQGVGPVAGQGPGNIASPFTFINGHMSFGSGSLGAPTVNAACGTGASVAGSDSAFVLTSGTSTASGCLVSPAAAWNRAPVCSVDNQTSATQAAYTVNTNGSISLTGVADSTTYNIICIGKPGG